MNIIIQTPIATVVGLKQFKFLYDRKGSDTIDAVLKEFGFDPLDEEQLDIGGTGKGVVINIKRWPGLQRGNYGVPLLMLTSLELRLSQEGYLEKT